MPDSMAPLDRLARLDAKLQGMPPVRAMGLHVVEFDGERLSLGAPLAANVNDKGCAFGGSLASAMTLAAWGCASLTLDGAGFADAEVYVQDSQLRYLAPLYDDLRASAQLAPGQDWAGFLKSYRERGKARAQLIAEIRCSDGRVAASFEGRFVALRPAG